MSAGKYQLWLREVKLYILRKEKVNEYVVDR